MPRPPSGARTSGSCSAVLVGKECWGGWRSTPGGVCLGVLGVRGGTGLGYEPLLAERGLHVGGIVRACVESMLCV